MGGEKFSCFLLAKPQKNYSIVHIIVTSAELKKLWKILPSGKPKQFF